MTRDHKLFLKWLLQFSFIFFFFYFVWDKGLLGELISADRSYITSAILFLFVIVCLHCGYFTFIISSELNKAHVIKKNLLTIEARNLFARFNIDKIH